MHTCVFGHALLFDMTWGFPIPSCQDLWLEDIHIINHPGRVLPCKTTKEDQASDNMEQTTKHILPWNPIVMHQQHCCHRASNGFVPLSFHMNRCKYVSAGNLSIHLVAVCPDDRNVWRCPVRGSGLEQRAAGCTCPDWIQQTAMTI